jgi:hypothetical protein
MRKHFFFTWFLRRLMPVAHADAILGDLFEVSGSDENAYRMLLRSTVWSLARRSVAGYVAAVLGGGIMAALQSQFFSSVASHEASLWQQSWGSTLAFLAGSMGLMLCFSAIRYGLRDRMTWIALVCTVPGIAAVEFWWVPVVPVAAGVCFLAFGAFILARKRTRRAFVSLMVLAALQPIVWFGGMTLLITPITIFLKHTHATLRVVTPFAVTWLIATYLALVMLSCLSYVKAHRIATKANSLDLFFPQLIPRSLP